MNEKLFECTICLGVCHDCIHCLDCHQILCKEHVQHFSSNRCPTCRKSPFRFEENIALQRIIEQMRNDTMNHNKRKEQEWQRCRQKERSATNIQKFFRGWKCRTRTAGGSTGDEIGSNGAHPSIWATIASESVEAANTPTDATPTATATVIPEEEEEDLGQYGCKIPCRPPHEDQYKKLPNPSHECLMLQHISECNDEDCRSLWRGRWGSFIGGTHGRTHFDLTKCPVGKRLNEQIGWDYNNPWC